MNIKQLPEPRRYPSVTGPRCSKVVTSCGTGNFMYKSNRCARVARFDIDGIGLCEQHAGGAALGYLLNKGQ